MFFFAAIFVPQASAIDDAKFRIEAMVMQDQEARNLWIERSKIGRNDPSVGRDVQRIDREDTAEMKKIVDRWGWPTISRFGKECAFDAWLLVQHADLDPAFQERCLKLMTPLLAKNQVGKENYAYLADRVSMKKTGKQLYGSQCKIEHGKVTLLPVIDPKNLDRRRKEMGMMPIDQYMKFLGNMYLPKK